MGGDNTAGYIFCCLLILGGAGVGTYYGVTKSATVTPTSSVILIPLKDGHYAMGEYDLTGYDANGTYSTAKLILSQVSYNNTRGYLRNSPPPEYRIHATIPETGYKFTFDEEMRLVARLDVETLTDYLLNTSPAARQAAASISVGDSITMNQTEAIKKLQTQMAKIFDSELTSSGFTFAKTPVVQLSYNSSVNRYKVFQDTSSRRMLIKRILFLNMIFDFLAKTIRQIALPVVNLVRDNGPMIGKIAGGLIGGALGGVDGFSQGMEVGEEIGIAAQMFVKACIPEQKLIIHCTQEGIKNAVLDAIDDQTSPEDVVEKLTEEFVRALCGKKRKCKDTTSVWSQPTTVTKYL